LTGESSFSCRKSKTNWSDQKYTKVSAPTFHCGILSIFTALSLTHTLSLCHYTQWDTLKPTHSHSLTHRHFLTNTFSQTLSQKHSHKHSLKNSIHFLTNTFSQTLSHPLTLILSICTSFLSLYLFLCLSLCLSLSISISFSVYLFLSHTHTLSLSLTHSPELFVQ